MLFRERDRFAQGNYRLSLSSQRQTFPSTYMYLSTAAILSTKGRLGERGGKNLYRNPISRRCVCRRPSTGFRLRRGMRGRERPYILFSLSLFTPALLSLWGVRVHYGLSLPPSPLSLPLPLMAPLCTKVLKDQGEHKHIVAVAFLLYPSSACYLSLAVTEFTEATFEKKTELSLVDSEQNRNFCHMDNYSPLLFFRRDW